METYLNGENVGFYHDQFNTNNKTSLSGVPIFGCLHYV